MEASPSEIGNDDERGLEKSSDDDAVLVVDDDRHRLLLLPPLLLGAFALRVRPRSQPASAPADVGGRPLFLSPPSLLACAAARAAAVSRSLAPRSNCCQLGIRGESERGGRVWHPSRPRAGGAGVVDRGRGRRAGRQSILECFSLFAPPSPSPSFPTAHSSATATTRASSSSSSYPPPPSSGGSEREARREL